MKEQAVVKCPVGQLHSHEYRTLYLWKFSKTELEMSNRKDLIKIILPEINKKFCPTVHILGSQNKIDIAKKSNIVSQNVVPETCTSK